jgi:deoxyhypusine synthase
MTWGKVDPEQLPDSIVCYLDSTVAVPVMAAYVIERSEPRPQKRLFEHRDELLAGLHEAAANFRPQRDTIQMES